jgi:hypothetical protein
VFKVNERVVVGPEALLKFLPGHYLPRMLQQDRQNLKGLASKSQFQPALTHFSLIQVNFKDPELDVAGFRNSPAPFERHSISTECTTDPRSNRSASVLTCDRKGMWAFNMAITNLLAAKDIYRGPDGRLIRLATKRQKIVGHHPRFQLSHFNHWSYVVFQAFDC